MSRSEGETAQVLGTVSMMLANSNCQTIILDRQPGQPVYLLCFGLRWNDVKKMLERRESLASHLVAGGPVE